jgi:hypothetical protein
LQPPKSFHEKDDDNMPIRGRNQTANQPSHTYIKLNSSQRRHSLNVLHLQGVFPRIWRDIRELDTLSDDMELRAFEDVEVDAFVRGMSRSWSRNVNRSPR